MYPDKKQLLFDFIFLSTYKDEEANRYKRIKVYKLNNIKIII